MRKQNGCANKPQSNLRGTEEGFSLCPLGCMHTSQDIRLALLKTLVIYAVIAYSIAGNVRLVSEASRIFTRAHAR